MTNKYDLVEAIGQFFVDRDVKSTVLPSICKSLGLEESIVGEEPATAGRKSFVERRLVNKDMYELLVVAEKVISEFGSEKLEMMVASIHGGRKGDVKNLIFASNGPKPTVSFDLINGKIKSITDKKYCLIYDKPIFPAQGLTLGDLEQWWVDKKYKGSLYDRLYDSLQSESEEVFFETYYTTFNHLGDKVPALIPQVYYYYHPKTIQQLGKKAFTQRMDFMLLVPRRNFIFEIDGNHHYSVSDPNNSKKLIPSPALYGEMAAETRQLLLAGYEVYRFGGYEIYKGKGRKIVREFFNELFVELGII
ncbi:hypothetical protein [Peribacillus asahii]|uniref:hypothetical protein n=1 Tax=Peribacillus asahii TaxID=228899 RepID=UPI00207ADB96|nr:hypothetical protein [Peribacillus asahii]USK71260.1 hypothetical protein LIS76_05715 [Peribacillus asahii]